MRGKEFKSSMCSNVIVLLAAVPVILLSGCITTGPGHDYASQGKAMREEFAAGTPDGVKNVMESLGKKIKGPDRLPYLEERGRILSLEGDISGSTEDYKAALAILEGIRANTPILEKPTKSSLAAYHNLPFENAALHHFIALNNLLSGKTDEALAAIDKIPAQYDDKTTSALRKNAYESATRENIGLDAALKSIAAQTKNYPCYATNVCVSGTAFGHYLKGVIDEASGNNERALDDYKNALKSCASSRFAAESAMRCARICDSRKDQSNLVNLYGNALRGEICPDNYGKLIVIFEAGFVKARSAMTVPVSCKGKQIMLNLPRYDGTHNPPDELDVFSGAYGARTQVIFDLDEAACDELCETYPDIIVSLASASALRSKSKAGEADLRSWLTLPQAIEIAELFLPAGRQKLACSTMSASQNVNVEIESGKTTILIIAQPGKSLIAESAVLRTDK
jgi:uncharacterized protein